MRVTDPKDHKRRFFRSEQRLFTSNGEWYFATREGDCGPFHSKAVATLEVGRFICERAELQGFQNSRRVTAVDLSTGSESLALMPLD